MKAHMQNPIRGKRKNGSELGCLVGFEPTSSGATVRRSTAELQAPQGGMLEPLIIPTGSRGRQRKSYPIQDEPEGEVGFQYKMSLERDGMLRIDHPHARSRETELGADPSFS